MLEQEGKTGVSNLLAEMLTKGTANRTPVELEQAIDALGASVNIYAGEEGITVSGNTLARNYEQTMAIVTEMLLEPRWDSTEFVLVKQDVQSSLEQAKANPNALASDVFRKLTYGNTILANNPRGTIQSISLITMDDLKAYYQAFIAPNVTDLHVVGSLGKQEIMAPLSRLGTEWKQKEVSFPDFDFPGAPDKSTVYFYDVPGAKQSVLNFGYLAMAETDPDFYPATIMNYKLGGGGFASRLTQELREGKGYTYGIRSGYSGSEIPGPFTIGSGVRTNVTYESAALVKEILADYPDTFTDEDMENTRSYFIKSGARAFETAGAKLNMLEKLSAYGWSPDYVTDRQEIVKTITKDRVIEMAQKYADPDKMIWVVVGDAETQLGGLSELGFGEPVLIADVEDIEVQ